MIYKEGKILAFKQNLMDISSGKERLIKMELKTTKQTRIIIVAIIAIVIMGAIIGWQYVIHSPQYSLVQAISTVKKHDYNGFKQYVDVDQIASDATDQIIAKVQADTAKETKGDTWAQLGAGLGSALIEGYKPQFKDKIINQVRQSIEEGNFGGDTISGKKISFVDFWTKTKVKQDGNISLITIPRYEIEKGKPASFKMRKNNDGSWQVYSIDFNIADLGNLSASNKSSSALDESQAKANDAKIKSAISQLRTIAEIIYDNESSSYTTVSKCFTGAQNAENCKGNEDNTKSLLSDISSAGGTVHAFSTDKAYCVSSVLSSDNNSYYCADSAGSPKLTNSQCSTATCP